MQKQTRYLAVAAAPQRAASATRKAQMGDVLDRQDMTTSRPLARRSTRRREILFRYHRPVAEKPPKPHRARPVAPQLAHDRAPRLDKTLGQQSPLFTRRSSPKRPANIAMNETILTNPSINHRWMKENHAQKPSRNTTIKNVCT